MPHDERALYDRLWAEARASFQAGAVEVDPHLDNREADTRRGLTLAARFDGALRPELDALLADLRALAPEQHVYRPDELHITILSVISAAPGFDPDRAPLDAYHALFSETFASTAPLTLYWRGLTATPGAVLLCGYSPDRALNALRDRLREALRRAGLDTDLELRYRTTAAHATLLRFRALPRRLEALGAYVEARRDRDYGASRIEQIEFVVNDWYMSHDRVRLLARYTLGGLAPE